MNLSIPSVLTLFVSHAHENDAWCREFVEIIRGYYRADVWCDLLGMRYGKVALQIERELTRRTVFICVLSPAAVASPWVRDEVDAALNLCREQPERIVIFVVAEPCSIPLLWSGYAREKGPDGGALSPQEAAARVYRKLSAWFAPADLEGVRAAWSRARDSRGLGDYPQAVAEYEDAIDTARRSMSGSSTCWEDLNGILRSNDPTSWDGAHRIFINLRSPTHWNREGDRLRRASQWHDAVRAYAQALTLDCYSIRAWIGAGIALEKLGELVDAVSALEYGLALDPNSWRGWEAYGRVRSQLDDSVAAMDAYDRALTLLIQTSGTVPNRVGPRERLREVLTRHGAGALIRKWRGSSKSRLQESTTAAQSGHLPFQHSLQWIEQGLAWHRLGRLNDALFAYHQALLLDRQSVVGWYLKGNTLADLRQYALAYQAYDHALHLDPHFVAAITAKGEALYQLGRFEEAAGCFDAAIALFEEDPITWYDKGNALWQMGLRQRAQEAFDRARALESKLEEDRRPDIPCHEDVTSDWQPDPVAP